MTFTTEHKQSVLEELARGGLTFSECVHFFSGRQSARDLGFVELAREQYEDEGTLEFDDAPIVSGSDEEVGAYVMAWVWVDAQ
jgi:hypothetical protein